MRWNADWADLADRSGFDD